MSVTTISILAFVTIIWRNMFCLSFLQDSCRNIRKIYMQTAPVNPIANINTITDRPLFKFGLVADIQYIDADDGTNFMKTKVRRYRQSLQIFRQAMKKWNSFKDPCTFSIVLGDTLDGQTAKSNTQAECMKDITDIVRQSRFPCHFCYGNHDYYAFNRTEILKRLIPRRNDGKELYSVSYQTVGGVCTPDKLYYDFSPCDGFRCVVLDSYDVSIIGPSSPETLHLANELLACNNPNDLSKSGTWFTDLPRESRRWVPYNGGISRTQLTWLERVLDVARNNDESVIIFCHQPVYAPAVPSCLVWNAEEVLTVLQKAGNVCMWMAGHDHDGQYAMDETGIHHLVPPAPLECEPGEVAYGHMEVHVDRLKLCWTGKTPKRSLLPWPTDLIISRSALLS